MNRFFHYIKKIVQIIKLLFYRPKGTLHFFFSTISYIFKSKIVLGKPIWITIEPSTFCNLKCPICETGRNELKREKGNLKWENFIRIVEQIEPFVNSVMFYFQGEPFLNKDAYRMIKHLKDKNIFVTTCTNGDLLNPKKIVESGIDEVNFQISGTTQEIHSIYRVNSNLNLIKENIKNIISEKQNKNTQFPKIILGFIIFKHNEHQAEDFFKMARELEVNEAVIVNTGVKTMEEAKKYLPLNKKYWNYDIDAFNKGILKPRIEIKNKCSWIYYSTTITYRGDVVPCCRDLHGKYAMGNILTEEFKKIWNNKKYQNFRKLILTRKRDCKICNDCWGFGVPLPQRQKN